MGNLKALVEMKCLILLLNTCRNGNGKTVLCLKLGESCHAGMCDE